jgi:hypothetical protein
MAIQPPTKTWHLHFIVCFSRIAPNYFSKSVMGQVLLLARYCRLDMPIRKALVFYRRSGMPRCQLWAY